MEKKIIEILLVEDDEAHAELVRRAYRSRGEDVRLNVADSLHEARERISRNPPDLVIADLFLPDGNGAELLPEGQRHSFPVMVMTSHGDEHTAVEALKAGALDYVIKSDTTLADMPHLVDGVLRQWENIIQRKQAEAALQKAYGQLEKRVEERTAELAATNAALEKQVAQRQRVERRLQKEQQLLRESLELQEHERKLIAYEIHDGLAQQLTGAELRLQTFLQLREGGPEEEAEKNLADGIQLLRDGLVETRRLIRGLRSPVLDEDGIVAAIEYLVQEVRDREAIAIEFTHALAEDRFSPTVETAVFRIVQETLTNACRHSRSDHVRIEMSEGDGRLHILVQDWGIGFDPSNIDENRFGLQGIRERVRLLGGKVAIDSAPNQGTRVTVDLPLGP